MRGAGVRARRIVTEQTAVRFHQRFVCAERRMMFGESRTLRGHAQIVSRRDSLRYCAESGRSIENGTLKSPHMWVSGAASSLEVRL